jgi:hypothetical protein
MNARRSIARVVAFVVAIACALSSHGCTGPGLCVHGGNWKYKIGTDPDAGRVSLVPVETTIDALIAFPPIDHDEGATRTAPVETTTWVVRDVELHGYQRSPDGDVHMVIADAHGHTMILEATPPFCLAETTPWRRQIARVRKAIDEQIPMAAIGWRTLTMSVAGIGYLDYQHGQLGVAENGVELHPVLSICFGKGCVLADPRG